MRVGPYNEREKAEFERLAESGSRPQEIAAALDRSILSIRNFGTRGGFVFAEWTRATVPEVRITARLCSYGFTDAMIGPVLKRTRHSVCKIRHNSNIRRPASAGKVVVLLSSRALGVLSEAAIRWNCQPGRIAACIVETACDGAINLLPRILPVSPPPRAPSPLSSLFEPALAARV